MYGGAGGGTNGEEEAVKTGSLTTSIGSRITVCVCVCMLVVVYSITARRWPLSHLYVSIHLYWNL